MIILKRNNTIKILTIIFAIFLISFQIYRAFNSPVWRDDGFFNIVAKNISMGNGYAINYFDREDAFHWAISSGPVVILPAAAMIKIFGNQYWVPAITQILIIWVLLAAVFFVGKKRLGKENIWAFSFIFLTLAILYSSGRGDTPFGIETGDALGLWHLLMGEIPAALLVILGSFVLFSTSGSTKKIALGGFILGISILSKTLAGLGCGVILVSTVIKFYKFDKSTFKQLFIKTAVLGTFFILPFLIFELSKYYILSGEVYFNLLKETKDFYNMYALKPKGLVGGLIDFLQIVGFLYILGVLGLFGIILIFSKTFIEDFFTKNKNGQNTQLFLNKWLGYTLIIAFLLQMVWFVGFSIGLLRYCVIGFMYLCAGVAILIASDKLILKNNYFNFYIVLMVLLPMVYLRIYFYEHGLNHNPNLQYQLDAKAEYLKLKKQGYNFISCGSNFELEYLLPTTKNFSYCYDKKTLTKKDILINFFVFIDPKDKSKNLILNAVHNNPIVSFIKVPKEIKKKCNKHLFSNKTYEFWQCGSK